MVHDKVDGEHLGLEPIFSVGPVETLIGQSSMIWSTVGRPK